MWKKVVKGTSTFTRAFLPYTSTPAFVILFLHLLFSRFSSFRNIISADVLSVNSEVFSFALLIYFLFTHFPLEVRQLYWQLAGHAIAVFFPFKSVSYQHLPPQQHLGQIFVYQASKSYLLFFLFFGNVIIHMNSNPGNVALA